MIDLGSPTYQGLQPWDTDLSFLSTLLSTISPSPFLVSSTMWMTTKYFGLSVPWPPNLPLSFSLPTSDTHSHCHNLSQVINKYIISKTSASSILLSNHQLIYLQFGNSHTAHSHLFETLTTIFSLSVPLIFSLLTSSGLDFKLHCYYRSPANTPNSLNTSLPLVLLA